MGFHSWFLDALVPVLPLQVECGWWLTSSGWKWYLAGCPEGFGKGRALVSGKGRFAGEPESDGNMSGTDRTLQKGRSFQPNSSSRDGLLFCFKSVGSTERATERQVVRCNCVVVGTTSERPGRCHPAFKSTDEATTYTSSRLQR